MNGKKAKLLRKVGKFDNISKKLYNSLSWHNKTILGMLYNHLIEKHKDSPENLPKKPDPRYRVQNEDGSNRKYRRTQMSLLRRSKIS